MTQITSDFLEAFNATPKKGELKSFLVFGAAGDLGENCAKEIARSAPDALLRVATSSEDKVDDLRSKFPDADVVVANYFDSDSLDRAFEGIEGLFIVVTDFFDEQVAMNNVVEACEKAGSFKHIVRIIGDPPGMRLKYVPQLLKDRKGRWQGPAVGHPLAREILSASDLPITYINMAAYLMKNFSNPRMRKPFIEQYGFLIFPFDHAVPLIDSREVGEIAGKILVSDDHRHINCTYDLDNGQDMHTVQELTEIISEEWSIDLKYVGDDMQEYAEAASKHPVKRYGLGLAEYSAYEWEFCNRFYLSDLMERLLGRKPKSFRSWLAEHRDQFDLSFYDSK